MEPEEQEIDPVLEAFETVMGQIGHLTLGQILDLACSIVSWSVANADPFIPVEEAEKIFRSLPDVVRRNYVHNLAQDKAN